MDSGNNLGLDEKTTLLTAQEIHETHQVNKFEENFKSYRIRWYVLLLYTAIALMCNIEWNTWGPISEPCKIVFGWQNWNVLLLSSWAAISIILSAISMTWIMDKKGLRVSVIVCALLMTVGKAFQAIPSSNSTMRTLLINFGQFIAMLSCPIGLGAPPFLSAVWFPLNERTTATAIATLVPYLGLSITYVSGPALVPTISLSNATNVTLYDVDRMRDNITIYMVIQLIVSAVLLVCVLIYFPSKPPLPPSPSSEITRPEAYREEIKQLLQDKSYLHLSFFFAISYGVYIGWIAVLALAVEPFGIGEHLAGWLGCASIIAGCCSGISIARYVDYAKKQTKSVLIVMFLGTSISQLLFSLTASRIIPFSQTLLYASIIMGGLFFNGTTPLLFEMAIESVYPLSGCLTAVMLLVGGYVVYLSFTVVFMFPGMNVEWMNWATVVFNAICVPGLLIYKAKFTRLDLDEKSSEDLSK